MSTHAFRSIVPAPQPSHAAAAFLIPIAGPALAPLELSGKAGGSVLGRAEQCDVLMPPDADKVSRTHARFRLADERWRVADLNSRWGTTVNGVRVTPGAELPLDEGDLVRVTPWTFTFSTSRASLTRRGLRAVDDREEVEQSHTLVRQVRPDAVSQLQDDMLALLLESASAIHAAASEKELADLIVDEACRGTGLQNAALIRPIDAGGAFEVIAARAAPRAGGGGGLSVDDRAEPDGPSFSRTLIAAASGGMTAEISGPGGDGNVSESIVQMRISAAVCVPLMLGQAVAAYLYLDSRSAHLRYVPQGASLLRPNAAAFCTALGRMASLALSNLKRIEIERRQAAMVAELSAAAAAQKWILPQRLCSRAGFEVVGESRAGAYVGGDFFDVIELGPGRVAVALGDVTGHGVAAGVLMTAAQGFLHAQLIEHGDVARAVKRLNDFIHPRRGDEKFVTLWAGVFDRNNGTLSYVDAGHGYGMLVRPRREGDPPVVGTDDGTVVGRDLVFEPLAGGAGLPVGLFDDATYDAVAVPLPPGGRALVVSDGIIEQFGPAAQPDGTSKNDQFGQPNVEAAISSARPGEDPLEKLFAAVEAHAGSNQLQDDATAVLVGW